MNRFFELLDLERAYYPHAISWNFFHASQELRDWRVSIEHPARPYFRLASRMLTLQSS